MVRRGGWATLPDGGRIAWSVADGHRGRRWRGATTRDGVLTASLLLEVGGDGRPVRLELAGFAGLLTLHPESGGSLHGNAVTAGGIRHLTFDWSDDHELEIEGNPIPSAVTAARLTSSVRVGEGRSSPVVIVGQDLVVRAGERRFERIGAAGSWRIVGDGEARLLVVDVDGLPVWPEPADDWPLELDDHG
jgi:hypothetical protein